jgi:exodeoxyribonuclease V alpha subunit
LSRRVVKQLGAGTVRIIREDPYSLASLVRGIGFRTADGIGRALGIVGDDPRRARAAVVHVLELAAEEGHVYLTRNDLASRAARLAVTTEATGAAVEAQLEQGALTAVGECLYETALFEAERSVAARLRALAGPKRGPQDIDGLLARVVDQPLTESQREAVRRTLVSGLVVLTGAPGTGKTTTIRSIVRAHLALGHRIELCAPTGRAAKRLAEATGHPARTIHRALEWSPIHATFQRDESSPLEAELVLVDEASMLNIQLTASLLRAVGPDARLVLVGDVDQLPPIGPGHVLRDLIASGAAPVVRLAQLFRQAEESAIVRGAHAILAGRRPTPSTAATRGAGDLFLVRARDPDVIRDRLRATLLRMASAYGLDPQRDVQVLTPMRRGPLGADRLNELLQAMLNPHDGQGEASGIRAGDRVMQLRNDYEREVFNGDQGTVTRVEGGMTFVQFDEREVQYKRDELDALSLAYACTVHKVQGSEFPAVVFVVHASHHVLLTRALLYTGLTRARRLVVLIGDDRAITRAIRTHTTHTTNSRLAELVAG